MTEALPAWESEAKSLDLQKQADTGSKCFGAVERAEGRQKKGLGETGRVGTNHEQNNCTRVSGAIFHIPRKLFIKWMCYKELKRNISTLSLLKIPAEK